MLTEAGSVALTEDYLRLIQTARQAAEHAFLANTDGVRYGAAVQVTSGRVFSSGQYSSFNHITNIHAEMGATLIATMSGSPDIVALAVVSTGSTDTPARPCGVCRQFLLEHAQRIGCDFTVIMTDRTGSIVELKRVSELIPWNWNPGTVPQIRPTRASRLTMGQFGRPLVFGDHVRSAGKFLSMVWHPEWTPSHALLKLKYVGDAKARHSFTEYALYTQQLLDNAVPTRLPWNDPALILEWSDIQEVIPRVPLARYPLAAFRELLDMFAVVGIFAEDVFLTGSWATGMANINSDWDIIVRGDPERIAAVRLALSSTILEGRLLSKATTSHTVAFLERHFGPYDQLLAEGRFADTFVLNCPDVPRRVSLIFQRPTDLPACTPLVGVRDVQQLRLCGTVTDCTRAAYKPGVYDLQLASGNHVSVECWHKLAVLLKPGDRVDVTVQTVDTAEGVRHFQFDSRRDAIAITVRAEQIA